MDRAIHARSGGSDGESWRDLEYFGFLVLYGAAYPIVFVAVLGPFLAPAWLVLAWAAAGSGIRPTRGAVGALLGGFVLTCVAFEAWTRLGCTTASCGSTTPLSDDLVWMVVGAAELLAGVFLWLSGSRRRKSEPRQPGGWRWCAAASAPLLLVVLGLWAHIAAG